ncbi:MAG: CBS domain-containing protein [Saprospiraceae bacterium]|nr:CBS domain-containing protein [Saprospiraceae bacterium]
MDKTPVTKFMATDLITFHPSTDIKEAIAIILKHRISGAPVVDKQKNLVGMLSESDCIRTIIDGPYNNHPSAGGTVADFMSKNVVTIDSSKTILDLAYEFTNSPYRRFPVVEKGRLVGQISRSDILRAIVKMRPKVDHAPSSWKGRMPQDKSA